jgi:hypothetical protein
MLVPRACRGEHRTALAVGQKRHGIRLLSRKRGRQSASEREIGNLFPAGDVSRLFYNDERLRFDRRADLLSTGLDRHNRDLHTYDIGVAVLILHLPLLHSPMPT